MTLWKISQRDDIPRQVREKFWPYSTDHFFSMVIRAENEEQVREMAASNHADEGADVWLNPDFTVCEQINVDGPPEIIIVE